MDSQVIVAILGTASVSSVVGVTAQGFWNRRKLSADTVEVIERVSGKAMERLEKRNDGLEKENEEMRKFLVEHRLWDVHAMREINLRGGHLEPPPVPPRRWLEIWGE